MSVEVKVACPCPGTPHPDGDSVNLRDKLGLAAGMAIQSMVEDIFTGKLERNKTFGLLAEAFVLNGVESWSFTDEAGALIPVDDVTIRKHLLADFELSKPIYDKADDLYTQAVISPLVERVKTYLPDSPTTGSTSASGTKPAPAKRSKRSSTTTTPTEGTEKTSRSLVGAYS